MATPFGRVFLTALSLLLALPTLAPAAGVQALFDLSSPEGGPFPSDRFTVPDSAQLTGLLVSLPKPDCTARPVECADIDVLNALDGFSVQPRLSIPLTGVIEPASVTSATVFLVNLGDVVDGGGAGRVVGINRVVWDPATTTLHVKADEVLEQHSRWALIVTDGVRDDAGDPVEPGDFAQFRHDLDFGQTKDPALKAYRKALLDALSQSGMSPSRVVAASVFTTQSVTAVMEKLRDQVKAGAPAPADFDLGPGGTRTVFPIATVTGLFYTRQVKTDPGAPGAFDIPGLFFPGLKTLIPGAVGALAFGKYAAPDYRRVGVPGVPAGSMAPVPTRTGTPVVTFTKEVFFDLVIPAGSTPPGGWPVAVFCPGFETIRTQGIAVVAAKLAEHGIATISINTVGHGGGPLSTITVQRSVPDGGPMTFPAGGRGVDGNGDGLIGASEGFFVRSLAGDRDPQRQTVVDLTQLVRIIEVGMDVDGDGVPDLDPARIYYFGISQGGIFGTIFIGLEPAVRAGVPNVAGGPEIEFVRLSPINRSALISFVAARGLLNVGGTDFDENLPLRDQPPLSNTVPGAIEIQKLFDRDEWAHQSMDAMAWAPYLRRTPLPGVGFKPVILQFVRGDGEVPNPTNTALIRAGDLADRTTFFRNDLAYAVDPTLPKDGHRFLGRTFLQPNPALPNYSPPSARPIALAAQEQFAVFFATDGTTVIDPDMVTPAPASIPVFEVPIVPPLPEDLGFIP